MVSDLAGGRKLNPTCWREVDGGGVIRNKRIPATELQGLRNWEQQVYLHARVHCHAGNKTG